MKILVIGSGGREHALVWKLAQSRRVTSVYCSPGNPGIAKLATVVPLKANQLEPMADFAEAEGIGLTVVGPEQPLAEGIVDLFRARGLVVFGPTKAAAELEWSKAFAKDFMRRYDIPTADYQTFTRDRLANAQTCIETCALPIVLKADGLAAGKGVIICSTREEARKALHEMTQAKIFGDAGNTVVVEEYLTGQEASVFAVCDGKDFVTLAPAQDHKRIFDGDEGKNTGGMGAYAPTPMVTPETLRDVEESIVKPTVAGMANDGRPYSGCLYVGIMLTSKGPKVVEFNVRFGDPETQVVLPLYDGDLCELLLASAQGALSSLQVAGPVRKRAVCVVIASNGYPDAYRTGIPIEGLDIAGSMDGVVVFHAGTMTSRNQILTSGGRVLGITSITSGTLRDAINRAYEAVEKVRFDGMHYRKDIGRKALFTNK